MTTPEGPYRWVACPGNGDDNYALSFRDLDPASVRARLNSQHAEIERLREALRDIKSTADAIYQGAARMIESGEDIDLRFLQGEQSAARLLAAAIAQEASE